MYYYPGKSSIPKFLGCSRVIVQSLKTDTLIQGRLLKYNYNAGRIAVFENLFKEAEEAELNKNSKFAIQLETKVNTDKLIETATKSYKIHTGFLRYKLQKNPEKLRKLFVPGSPRKRRVLDILKHMNEVYDRAIEDDEIVASLAIYGITKEDLMVGQAGVEAAIKAKVKHTVSKIEAQDATALRDKAFRKLGEAIKELVILSKIVLEDRPQLLQKMGLRVYSENYSRNSEYSPASRRTKEESKPELQAEPVREKILATDEHGQKTRTKDKSGEGREVAAVEPDLVRDTVFDMFAGPASESPPEGVEEALPIVRIFPLTMDD